jgi:hypothetical protein
LLRKKLHQPNLYLSRDARVYNHRVGPVSFSIAFSAGSTAPSAMVWGATARPPVLEHCPAALLTAPSMGQFGPEYGSEMIQGDGREKEFDLVFPVQLLSDQHGR